MSSLSSALMPPRVHASGCLRLREHDVRIVFASSMALLKSPPASGPIDERSAIHGAHDLSAQDAYTAMKAGKHVYLQKPLTYSVYESRLLKRLARENKVVTQMGNQGFSHECNRVAAEIIGVSDPDVQKALWRFKDDLAEGLKL